MILWLIESNTNKARSTEVIDLSVSDIKLYPYEYNLEFAVLMLNSQGQPIPYDPTYFTIKMLEISTYGHGSYRKTNTTDLGMYDWSKDFPILSDLHNTFNLSGSLMWPQNKRFKLSGNFYSDTSSIFSIKLYRWSGSSLCHSSTEIND